MPFGLVFSMEDPLKRIVWDTLTGPHSSFSTGTTTVRRYAPGFSPIVGFESVENLNFDELNAFCGVGEKLYVGGWSGLPNRSWNIDFETTVRQMVWAGTSTVAEESMDAIRLGPEHVPQALDLAELTHPGPFGPRTIELGEYFGIFEGARLVAMAGERMFNGTLREISGVCTHPEFRGKGLARRLMMKLIYRQLRRNEKPFLHVLNDNANAHALYERMGFYDQHELALRVISRCEKG